MRILKSLALAIAVSIFLISSSHVHAQNKGGGGKGKGGDGTTGPSYTIVPLDAGGHVLDEGRGKVGAFDISDVGAVVGAGYDPIAERTAALFWILDGTDSLVIPLPDLEFYDRYYAVGRGVNNLDQVIGWTTSIAPDGSVLRGALFWPSPVDVPLVLPPLSVDGDTYAYGINDSGVICGISRDPELDADGAYIKMRTTPVVWSVTYIDGQPQVFGPMPLPSAEDGRANAISSCDANGVAHVAGGLVPANGMFGPIANAAVTWRVVLQPDGSLTADPQPVVLEIGEAEAFAINDMGAVAGQSMALSEFSNPKGRVWVNGTGQTLADYPSRKIRGANYHAYDIHTALGINDSGVVVGNLDYASSKPEWEAAVWLTPTSQPIALGQSYLPDPRLTFSGLVEARAINSAGVIVGKGHADESNSFTFLAVPQ